MQLSHATAHDEGAKALAGAEGADKGKVWHKLMNLMMQLRNLCNHPFLMPGGEPAEGATFDQLLATSGKMQVLDKLLEKLKRGDHRVLCFSNFTHMLDILEDFCRARGYKYLRLDGSTNRVLRKFDIARFNANRDIFIYLISTRAGGLGINLATADTVIHYDSDFNPQVDLQAQVRPCSFSLCLFSSLALVLSLSLSSFLSFSLFPSCSRPLSLSFFLSVFSLFLSFLSF
jgi:superfamily II DNA or RNA helicase